MRYDNLVPFIDREVELSVLIREYGRRGFSLVTVYGRRRVGKTRLLREFLSKVGGVYYVTAELSYPLLAREFARAVADYLGRLPRSEDVVDVLVEIAEGGGRPVVVIDEFQYLVAADPSLPSRLQRAIDTNLSNTDLMLVLSGSAVSFFEAELLGYKAPLHGRMTANIRLRPMRFLEALGFLEKMPPDEAVRTYSVLGGTPAYLGVAYGKEGLAEVLEEMLLPGSVLVEEAESLLRQELREPRRYMAILRSVAEGRVSPYEAASMAGIDARSVHRYLEVLEGLDIIVVRKPLGFRRGARVFFRDHYFRFWFRYVQPMRHLIELGHARDAIKHILQTIDSHTSTTFESVVEESLPELFKLGAVPTRPLQHGPWWHRGEEIDLVIREPGQSATFIEVKWADITIAEARKEAARLAEKAKRTGLQERLNHYVVIARKVEGVSDPYIKEGGALIVDFTNALPELRKLAHQRT